MFPIYRVQKSSAAAPEQLGSKYKFWYWDGPRRMLFKAEDRGTGEDWAEKITDCLCEELGLPHVRYELAELFDGDQFLQPGVICETCVGPGMRLVLGNELMLSVDDNYPSQTATRYRVKEHTIQAVGDVFSMRQVDPPPQEFMRNVPPGISSAMDVFAGYLMLDAWIANQDRHHENWGALLPRTFSWKLAVLPPILAPTFDHGAALARNLQDREREERLLTKDKNRTIESFANRARSAFYASAADSRPLGTSEAFLQFAAFAPQAATIWLDQLAAIPQSRIQELLDQVPDSRMSGTARRFTLELLHVNQCRLLNDRIST